MTPTQKGTTRHPTTPNTEGEQWQNHPKTGREDNPETEGEGQPPNQPEQRDESNGPDHTRKKMRARPPNQPQKEKDSKAPNYIKQRRRTGTTPKGQQGTQPNQKEKDDTNKEKDRKEFFEAKKAGTLSTEDKEMDDWDKEMKVRAFLLQIAFYD